MHIEDELKQALRAEDPGAAFTQRVLARAREERGRAPTPAAEGSTGRSDAARTPISGAAPPPARVTPRRYDLAARRLIAAVAASLALTAAGAQWIQHVRYVREGERARAQVLTALRLTSEKLNQVHDAITESTEPR